MLKPVRKHPRPEVYNYHEVMRYLEDKYQVNDEVFWSWLCDLGCIRNGCYFGLGFDWLDDPDTSEDIKEILRLLDKEFAEGQDLDFWVSW